MPPYSCCLKAPRSRSAMDQMKLTWPLVEGIRLGGMSAILLADTVTHSDLRSVLVHPLKSGGRVVETGCWLDDQLRAENPAEDSAGSGFGPMFVVVATPRARRSVIA